MTTYSRPERVRDFCFLPISKFATGMANRLPRLSLPTSRRVTFGPIKQRDCGLHHIGAVSYALCPRSKTWVGLSFNAIFQLWKPALKDGDRLLDEASAAARDQMISFDRARVERVIRLSIRRHRDAKGAFNMLADEPRLP